MPSNAFQLDSNALQSNAVWQEAMPKIDILVGRCRLRPGDRRVWGGSGGSSQAGATIITASHVRPVSQTSLWAAAAAATLAQMA